MGPLLISAQYSSKPIDRSTGWMGTKRRLCGVFKFLFSDAFTSNTHVPSTCRTSRLSSCAISSRRMPEYKAMSGSQNFESLIIILPRVLRDAGERQPEKTGDCSKSSFKSDSENASRSLSARCRIRTLRPRAGLSARSPSRTAQFRNDETDDMILFTFFELIGGAARVRMSPIEWPLKRFRMFGGNFRTMSRNFRQSCRDRTSRRRSPRISTNRPSAPAAIRWVLAVQPCARSPRYASIALLNEG